VGVVGLDDDRNAGKGDFRVRGGVDRGEREGRSAGVRDDSSQRELAVREGCKVRWQEPGLWHCTVLERPDD